MQALAVDIFSAKEISRISVAWSGCMGDGGVSSQEESTSKANEPTFCSLRGHSMFSSLCLLSRGSLRDKTKHEPGSMLRAEIEGLSNYAEIPILGITIQRHAENSNC